MSNAINFKFKRKRIIQRFKSSGGKAVNDCMRPSAGASKVDLFELHSEKMRLKKAKRGRFITAMQQKVEAFRKDGSLVHRLMNLSRNKKRDRLAVSSIWPEGKVARPGRMG